MTKDQTEKVLFQAELKPNQSNTRFGVQFLSIILCSTLVPAGYLIISLGAWPVFCFFGLELLLLIGLLNVNHRRSYMMERISLTAVELRVERVDILGRMHQWSFQPYWLRVNLFENTHGDSKLELRSHGRGLTIGSFLSQNARRNIALELRNALRCPDPTLKIN